MTPPKDHTSLVTDSKYSDTDEMPDEEVRKHNFLKTQ
jgi:hypothetical protein